MNLTNNTLPRAARAALVTVLSAALLAWAWSRQDGDTIARVLREARLTPAALGLTACALSQVFSARRMQAILSHRGIQVSRAEALRLYFAAAFANLCMPGGAGGDVLKCFALGKHGMKPTEAARVALSERANGFWALCLNGLLFAAAGSGGEWLAPLLPAAAVILTFCYRIGSRKLCGESGGGERAALPYSLAAQMCQAAGFAACCFSTHAIPESISAAADIGLAFCLSSVASMLPLSFGGIGVRETVISVAGAWTAHFPETEAVAAASVFFLVQAAASLPGAFALKSLKPSKDKL